MAGFDMKLVFNIQWSGSSTKNASVTDATRGTLQVTFGDDIVWPAFEWTWVDFLEHLARVWPLLRWQPWPLGLAPATPSEFPKLANERLHLLAGPSFDSAETEVWSFTEAHDLAHALGGIGLPSLWLVPEGAVVHVATEHRSARLAPSDSIDALEAFVTEISNRLEPLAHPRARAAIETWAKRNKVGAIEAIELYTGIALTKLRVLARSSDVAGWFEVGTRFAETELVAVARATRGRVDVSDLRKIRERVRLASAKANKHLSSVTEKATAHELAGRPWEQGYQLAVWLRGQLGSDAASAVDPAALLKTWDVKVDTVTLETQQIDAVACWGPKHGPLIVINAQGTHAKTESGRRATLAHEICHLLVDRHEALPLAEAAGGQIAADLEARARAFAAEFLAPRAATFERWAAASGSPETRLKAVCQHYRVSSQLAAWQLLNSGRMLLEKERSFLERHAKPPR
ncbi:MAG: hypothetical protein DI536_05935 [Archangium gephyra]|uniref:IrrE N-terminal-like domain-containing protein n=1 Tax=Archangium gephyra TaxID=48 RepID=A0A2W5VLF7_9BACT|nr:MAG: hypothetical protein DI536_05935 [Archangium gephyra]